MSAAETKEQLYDVSQVRQHARQSVEQGPVTEDYALDLEQACYLLNEALAAEILCVLRYRHHQIIAKGIDFPQVAEEFAEHAADEHEHMMMIAERIDQLGGDPDFNPATVVNRSSSEYGSSGTNVELTELIKEDLVAERIVIEIYRKLISYFGNADPTSRRMFEKILEDEEEHANDLSDLLAAIDPRSKPSQ
ncbi:MAG: bacterioferritin [Chroococcidiopsidaceae cyanobacterium CP_BM_RX_35]|nr:bacterioferritin [Chroococcidiopsidaceae cyanobacterium CP_BM_RX_35]